MAVRLIFRWYDLWVGFYREGTMHLEDGLLEAGGAILFAAGLVTLWLLAYGICVYFNL